MKDWLANDQLTIERGSGIYLYDTKGNKYIDGVSSLWVTVHGHNKKEINQAIQEQLKKISHTTLLGLSHKPAEELAQRLIKIAPKGLAKVFYSDNGSTAVEVALKIAFEYQQLKGFRNKTRFITLKNAYHGDTIGSVSVGGMDLFHEIFKPLLFNAIKVEPNLAEVEKVLRAHHQEIAGMIIEPGIQAAAGMLLEPSGFVKGIRALCTKYNILLICDEVATGFGRTGKMFSCDHDQVSPDLMCVAKGLTGGYLPVAVTLTTTKIFEAFLGEPKDNKTFFHGHTYTANPLGCAAAIANLKIFKKEKTLQKLQPKIKTLTKGLQRFKELACVNDIRQYGFMVGIELEGFKPEERIGHKVILQARKLGAILRPLGNVIVLMPPLSISENELNKLLQITYDSIALETCPQGTCE